MMVETLHGRVLRDVFCGGQFIGMDDFWSFKKGTMVFYRGDDPKKRGVYRIRGESSGEGWSLVAEGGISRSAKETSLQKLEANLCVPLPSYFGRPGTPKKARAKAALMHLGRTAVMKISCYDDGDMAYSGHIDGVPAYCKAEETLSPSLYYPLEDPDIQEYLRESPENEVYPMEGGRIIYDPEKECFMDYTRYIYNLDGIFVCLSPDRQFLFDLFREWGRSPASCGYCVSRDGGTSWTSPVMIQTWGGKIDFLIGETRYKNTNSFEGHPLALSLEQDL
jgi:hypothetical protein